MRTIFKTSDINIDNTGKSIVTKELQELIDKASQVNGKVVIEEGIYQTASLFLKSNMEFHISEKATILGTTDESQYEDIFTRVAGIEMDWYPGLINCNNQTNVTISGSGFINGNGSYWWEKYWGNDTKSGMRKIYDEKGLRWACDYDCKRVRNVVIANSSNINLKDFTSTYSGFWNIHLLYSFDIIVDNVKIDSHGGHSPSTDGIDIDSCHHVIIKNCITNCNDDSICIKSGRDYDGVMVNKPCHDIIIQDCTILAGFGITIGSEVSGGVYNIIINNIKYVGSDCGFRIKSSFPRKGYIKDVNISNLEMLNVKYAFHMYLNWNPNYSICTIPSDYKGEIKTYWRKLITVLENERNTVVSNIKISNIKSSYDENYDGISRAFNIEGFKDEPITNITFDNLDIKCKEYGIINYVKNVSFSNFRLTVTESRNSKNDDYDNR